MRLLIKPTKSQPRFDTYRFLARPTQDELRRYLSPDAEVDAVWALDLETTGLEAHNSQQRVIGIGLSGPTYTVYVRDPFEQPEFVEHLHKWFARHRLVAFNVAFDAAWLKRDGFSPNFIGDAWGLFKQLSGDSKNLRWDLESMQREVLSWVHNNKADLAKELEQRGLDKSQMHKLPPEVVAVYCMADADSTLQGWNYLADLASRNYPELMSYHQRYFMTEVRLLVETQLRGVYIDPTQLDRFLNNNYTRIHESKRAFMEQADVAAFVNEKRAKSLDALRAAEPPRYIKDGSEAVAWQRWRARMTELALADMLNVQSPVQLQDLFFTRLKNRVHLLTKTGKPSVGKKVLPLMGEPGRLLAAHKIVLKQSQYATAVKEKVINNILHLQFKSVGTITGRLGGSGGVSCQQQPKIAEYLVSWRARPGYVLVQADIKALEPVILAQFSEDPALLSLYGVGAVPNDIYLYFGSKAPGLSKVIRQFYDPDAPSAESVATASKQAKRERTIAKLVVLACMYGVGINTLTDILRLSGVELKKAEVRKLHDSFNRVFHGIKRWAGRLEALHERTGGWVPSMLGCPIPVAPDYIRDIVNRHTQRSGHEFLQVWLFFIDKLRHERHVEMYPWIPDLHDETIWEAKIEHADAAKQILQDALAMANEMCALTIPLEAVPDSGPNFAAIKVPKDWEEYKELFSLDDEEEDDDE